MDGILQFTTVYVDDLLITSANWEEHCDHIERALCRLSDNHLTLKLDKTKLLTEELQFLGFVLSGIPIHQRKLKLSNEFLSPRTSDS